jgi:WhiB family redox-sensing transcriptional regulator
MQLLPGLTPVDRVRCPGWMRDAACREHPEVAWFPRQGVRPEHAKAVCRGCLVRAECLAFALDQPDDADYGVWGGTTRAERRRARERGVDVAHLLAVIDRT